MKKTLISAATLLIANISIAQISFSGHNRDVIAITPQSSTGLNNIYVLYNSTGVSASYTASSNNNVTWYRYSNLGGGYAEPIIDVIRSGSTYTLSEIDGDMGYIIEEGSKRTYFWVVNYASHYLDLQTLSISPEQDCATTALGVIGSGDKIYYYTINGRQMELDRELSLVYSTLVWDKETETYTPKEITETFSYLPSTIYTSAPLCDTDFILSGDRFLRQWGEDKSVKSPLYSTIAVAAETTAIQTLKEYENEQKEDGAILGGSAPIEITFKAAVTDAAIYQEWQISDDPEFENILMRFNDLEVSHTFQEYGTYYIRFMASNNAGTCDYFSETYEVAIGESRLECPNAFSPDASEGVNDEWKVSYKSIIEFECHIFNRWGIKVAELIKPSQGWDGRHGGKFVPAGVYYYVIKAKGADGKDYNLSGDINIINYNNTLNNSSTNSNIE